MVVTQRKLASGVLATLVFAAGLLPFLSVRGDTTSAVSYLKTKTISAWSAMALAAVGETADVSSLKNVSSANGIDYAAPVLALTAQGKDPRSYPNTDYIAKLQSFYDGTQFGNAGVLNDDIFALLALRSAGIAGADSISAGISTYLLNKQNADGGWPLSTSGSSDTNTTAAAIMALVANGTAKTDLSITKAVSYLKSAQNSDGGFTYDPTSSWGTTSDASSDAWVIAAATALGEDAHSWTKDGKSPFDHLLSLQNSSGFFSYQENSAEDAFSPVTTAYAVIALSGKTLPVKIFVQPAAPQVSYRIAGEDNDLCTGETNALNPLELIKIVAQACNTDYHITDTAYGPYLDRIGTDTGAGAVGWMYTVNFAEPSVGAVDYVLKADDSVLWYFADFNNKQTRISLSSPEISSGASVTALVEYYDAGVWKPIPQATVHAANSTNATGADGRASLQLPDGSYKIYATAVGYVRTEADTLIVGGKSQTEFPLTATVEGVAGGGGGGAGSNSSGISFVLGTPTGEAGLGFGSLKVGESRTKTLTVTNNSQSRIYIEAIVSGDDLFRNYVTINNAAWRAFNDKLDGVSSKNFSVGMSVPSSYAGSGAKSGKLTIWAVPTN